MNIPINCKACGLHKFRDRIVIGRGNIPAQILFIGEAPGLSEDTLGVPFVGKSGELLEIMIDEACIKSKVKKIPTYYITNTVLCRPTDKHGGSNREPKKEEILKCRSNLIEIIETVEPVKTVFIGNIAENFCKDLFNYYSKIQHPAYLLRGGGVEHPHYIRNVRILTEIFKEVDNES